MSASGASTMRSPLMTRGRVVVLTVVLLGFAPIPRKALAEWTVTVVDQTGRGIPGVVVGQSWDDYAFNEYGDRELITDPSGKVVFPSWTRWRPLVYLATKRLLVLVNVHAGRGQVGQVWAPFDPRLEDLQPGKGTSAQCELGGCTTRPLTSTLQLKVRTSAQ